MAKTLYIDRVAALGCRIDIIADGTYAWSWDFYRASNSGPFASAADAARDFLAQYGPTAEHFAATGLRHYGRQLGPVTHRLVWPPTTGPRIVNPDALSVR